MYILCSGGTILQEKEPKESTGVADNTIVLKPKLTDSRFQLTTIATAFHIDQDPEYPANPIG